MDFESHTVEDNDVEIVNSGSPSEAENVKKRNRAATSDVWSIFSKPINGKVKCGQCEKEYIWSDSSYGTSTLKRHLNVCKNNPKYKDVGQMLDGEGKLRPKKIDQNHVRQLISMAIISHDLPLSFVEYHWVRELLKYLNPDVKSFGRLTATTDVLKLYEVEKEKLKHAMIGCPGRICLTSDCWTACTGHGYISLTAHFVGCDWKLNSKILNFCRMEPPHTGFELANKLFGFLKEWGIEKKVFSLTLDNASANDNMQDNLKERLSLQNSLVCNGEFFHVRCCAHILNLIVQEGLKVADEALKKIRQSIKYVKSSEGRMKTFLECVTQVGGIDTKSGLRMDVCTRWNSTYTMLESAIVYKRAFSLLQLNDQGFKFAPTNEEWARGEKMCDFLRPFFVITNLISGSSYPTSNLYFLQVWKIECFLKLNLVSEDEVIKSMVMRMQVKFDKYWSEYNTVLSFGAVLDPRSKLGMIKHYYSQLDSNTAQGKVDRIRSKLQALFGEYEKWKSVNKPSGSSHQSSSSSLSFTSTLGGKSKEQVNAYPVMEDWQSKSIDIQIEKSELDRYLDEPPMELKYNENLNVLTFWKDNKSKYPTLSVMACDILSIQITTVASESAFSIGSRVVNKYRSRLLGKNVEALMCTRSWLQGFTVDDDEEELEDDVLSLSKEGSNVVD
ncbi:hypothetical protein ACS0TY_024156 [Phlomoides rotata]